MPSVAAWLLARPYNAVFALAATMLVQGLQTISGAILVLLVLQQNLRKASIAAGLAASLLLVVAVVSGTSPLYALVRIGSLWLPVLGLAAVMRTTRSLTLTLQLSVMLVLLGTCMFFVLASDPVAYWQEMIAATPLLQNLQLQEWKSAVGVSEYQFAGVMTTIFAIGFWFGLVIVILLGYWVYQQQPGKSGQFGRICDLNFGRVIALLLAITSVVGFAFNAVWIQSIAVILFAVFWLQGTAVVHWFHAAGNVPVIAVILFYCLTILSLIIVQLGWVIPAVAVLGYIDAWFGYRNRVVKQQ